VHVFLKKTIEITDLLVTERHRNPTDFAWWEDAKQPFAEAKPHFHLILEERLPVSCYKTAVQCAHLHAQFAGNGA
jgi:hypothetical protein